MVSTSDPSRLGTIASYDVFYTPKSTPSTEGPIGDQTIDQLRSEEISNLETHLETRARNAVGLFEGKLLIDMMDKCPRLSVFVMVGFPFDNDQLIRQIGDRVARASANATSSSSSSSHKASGLAGSVSIPSRPYYTGLKKLELTNLYFCRVKAKPVEYLLNHCTPDLEELLLSVSFGSRTEAESDDTDVNAVPIPGTSNTKTTALTRTPPLYEDSGQEWKLRKLTIKGDLSGPGPLIWLPLLRRCSQLQEICVDVFKYETMEQLATTLSRCCPKISEITLQCITGGPQEDSRIADLIKASRSWKRLSMSFFHGFGPLSTTALIKHSGTLETLVLDECDGITSEDIQLVLTSCSNLKTFRAMTSNGMTFSSTVYLDASDMVDSPWACQNLENLKLVITGIARPDLQENQYGEQFVGPLHDGTITGYDLQKTVYEQLGKLTKLQELWLGHDKQDLDDEENYHPTEVEGQWQFIDPDEQFECLEFSLKSGLDLLHGLNDLKVLNIDRMKTKIGLSEVQWMVKQWPKLERIIGLVIQGEKTPKHVQWLYDNRPDIELPPVLGHFITAFSAF
ncbi:hypothetical protein BGZ80_001988 [Entomortierella chlamydospora]|uniref:Uncharacterized protein n=1 Tax=Entomortierella chlamydospora TaxID=101097 RepID=A0A9P6MQF3_9FUNG|nr:hypothetical protein BGZ80_001988 [Entomortierella chlamydospora]